MDLFVGPLPPGISDLALRQLFESFGDVTYAQRWPHQTFGFVEMPKPSEAIAAIQSLQGSTLKGKTLTVCDAISKEMTNTHTFHSFLHFLAGESFTGSQPLFKLMQQLAQEKIQWVTSLEPGRWNNLSKHPRLVNRLQGAKILTLGPLEGSLDWTLATAGAASVTGVEGYWQNFLKCQALSMAFPSLPLEFIESDVMAMDVEPDYNIIVCYGVLYHLDQPHLLLKKLRELQPNMLFLATQVAVDPPHPAFRTRQLKHLSRVELNNQYYDGRLYVDQRSSPLVYGSSLEDQLSFWFYPEALKQLLLDLGFHLVDWGTRDQGQAGLLAGAVATLPR